MESTEAAAGVVERPPREGWSVVAGISGILFPILLFLGKSAQPENFPYGERGDEAWIRYLEAEPQRYRLGFFLEGLAWMLFLVFVLGLAAWLIGKKESDRALGWVAAGAGLLLTAVSLVPFVFLWPLTWEDTLATEGAPIRIMAMSAATVNNGAFGFMAFPLVLLSGAAGLYMLRTRALPRWVGWFSVALAVVSAIHSLEVLAPETFGVFHMFGFFGFLLWPLLTGASLVGRSLRAAPGLPRSASPS